MASNSLKLTVRSLSWPEGERLVPCLKDLAPRFASAEELDAWLEAFDEAWSLDRASAIGVFEGDDLVGALLLSGSRQHQTVAAQVGQVPPEVLAPALALAQRELWAITWSEGLPEGWETWLVPAGFAPFERGAYVQDLARVPLAADAEPDPEIRPWEDRDFEPTSKLVGQANEGTLDGLIFTEPEWPSAATCRFELARMRAGGEDTFMPEASFVAFEGERLLGAVVTVRKPSGRALLYELAVSPAAQGRRLGLRLVRTLQRRLLALGIREMEYATTANNAAVQRMFTPDELVSYEGQLGAYWIRPDKLPGA